MELMLSRELAFERIFPAIDVFRSGTRKEELILSPEEMKAANLIRNHAAKNKDQAATKEIIHTFNMTGSNEQLIELLSKPTVKSA